MGIYISFALLLLALSSRMAVAFSTWGLSGTPPLNELTTEYLVWAVVYGAATWHLRDSRYMPGVMLLTAASLLCRGIFISAPVMLTGDMPRYLWEGLLVRHGFNPYLVSPSMAETVRIKALLPGSN